MSEPQNSFHDSIDTSPLTLGQLSDHEFATILSIEHQLMTMQAGASEDARNAKEAKSYFGPGPGTTPTGAAAGRCTRYRQDITIADNGALVEYP